ncbi:hypothetical protein NN561_017112 [Cricetulus griseus]
MRELWASSVLKKGNKDQAAPTRMKSDSQQRLPSGHLSRDWLKIYTDWANHYLAKSGHKRLIKDLQQDVTDGVLLAQIIQVVANDKIEDINGCPKNRSQMVSGSIGSVCVRYPRLCTAMKGYEVSSELSELMLMDTVLLQM